MSRGRGRSWSQRGRARGSAAITPRPSSASADARSSRRASSGSTSRTGSMPSSSGAAGVGGADDPPGRGARCLEGRLGRDRRRDAGRVRPQRAAEVPDDALVVVVHDAARPWWTTRSWSACSVGSQRAWTASSWAAAPRHVKRVERSVVVETIRREELVAVQTPQAFLADRSARRTPATSPARRTARADRAWAEGSASWPAIRASRRSRPPTISRSSKDCSRSRSPRCRFARSSSTSARRS